METIKGTVTRFLFSSENGYKVIRIRQSSGKSLIITGEFGPDIVKDTIASFNGDYKSHPKYGSQFKVFSYEITYNVEELSSIKLFIDTIAPNIGLERAEAIVSYFGKETVYVLDNTPDRLIEAPGVGEVSAESLKKAWIDNRKKWDEERQVYSLRTFLNSMGIKERRVKKVLSFFGGGVNAEEIIRNNPYKLIGIEGFGFSTVDFIARKLNVPENSPERLKSFLIYLLDTIREYGHLYLKLEEIPEYVNKYCLESSTKFVDKTSLNISDISPFLNILEEEKIIKISDDCVYHSKSFFFEQESAILLSEISTHESDLLFLNKGLVGEYIKKFETENNLELSKEQKDAMHYFAEHKVFVITGVPGSGKTTILKAIVGLAMKMKLNLTCMTPTGISAKKLASTINNDAYTIHRKLGFRGNEWLYNEDNKFDTDVVILDESSMIDQELFYRLLSALRNRVHIVIVGDQHQLPSVGAGNVLKEVINSGALPVVKLEKIFRQAEASDIIKVAHKIKNGDSDLSLFKDNPESDVFFIRKKEVSEIESIIVNIAKKFKDEKRNFQIITPRKDGPLGVATLNEILQKVLNPPSPNHPEINLKYFTIRKGDRVIVRKNDYDNDIFNGDIGKVIDISGNIIVIDIDDRFIPLSVEDAMDKIQLAYSITCHKCVSLDAFISCPGHLQKMGQVTKGSYVINGISNATKVIATNDTELKKVIIKTRMGYSLTCSSDHPIRISTDKNHVWKKIEDISLGQYACINRIPLYSNSWDNKIRWIEPKTGKRGNRIYKRTKLILPQEFNEDLSWMMGALVGDGNYTDKKDGIVSFCCPNDPILRIKMKQIWERLGLTVNSHLKGRSIKEIYVCSKNFRDFLEQMGLQYVKGSDKRLPRTIFGRSPSCRSEFLHGLYDADGSVEKKGRIRLTSCSKELCEEVQMLLLSLGIISGITSQGNRHHKVSISGDASETFFNSISLTGKKGKLLDNFIHNRGRSKTNIDIIPSGKKISKLIWNLLKRRGVKGEGLYTPSFKRTAVKLERVKSGACNLSIRVFKESLAQLRLKGIEIPKWLKLIECAGYFYDPIIDIKITEEKTQLRDIEVDDGHSFVANGFICHNSQGLEYKYVILPFINQFGKMLLQRNLIYTAITRAKKKVIVLGHGSAIERAINNSSVSKRNTNLGARIKKCLHQKKKNSFPKLLSEPVSCPQEKINMEPLLSEIQEYFPSVSPEN